MRQSRKRLWGAFHISSPNTPATLIPPSFMFWLIREIRFCNYCLPFLWGLIWFNDSWHFIQYTLSFFTAIKNSSLSPWQQRRCIQCYQIYEQLWLSSILTHDTIGGPSKIIISNGFGNWFTDVYRWPPTSNLTLSCVLCCFQKKRGSGNFPLFLIWVWKTVRKIPFQKKWFKELSPPRDSRKCPLQCLCGGSYQD